MKCYRDQWCDLVASEHGPARAHTRHVLLTVGLHMQPDGSRCYPSVRTIATRTGLSGRSVMTHLAHAEVAGWIARGSRGASGQGWRRHQYHPTLPKVVQELHHVAEEGGAGDAPRQAEGGAVRFFGPDEQWKVAHWQTHGPDDFDVDAEVARREALLAGHYVWVENHPYVSFTTYPVARVRPSRSTIFLAHDRLVESIMAPPTEGEEDE